MFAFLYQIFCFFSPKICVKKIGVKNWCKKIGVKTFGVKKWCKKGTLYTVPTTK